MLPAQHNIWEDNHVHSYVKGIAEGSCMISGKPYRDCWGQGIMNNCRCPWKNLVQLTSEYTRQKHSEILQYGAFLASLYVSEARREKAWLHGLFWAKTNLRWFVNISRKVTFKDTHYSLACAQPLQWNIRQGIKIMLSSLQESSKENYKELQLPVAQQLRRKKQVCMPIELLHKADPKKEERKMSKMSLWWAGR